MKKRELLERTPSELDNLDRLYAIASRRGVSRRRRRELRHRSGRIASAAVVLTALVLGMSALLNLQGNRAPASPASPYVIQDMFVSSTTVPWLQGAPTTVGVTYKPAWSSDQYPGPADCTFAIRDGQGTVLGSATGVVDSTLSVGRAETIEIELKEWGVAPYGDKPILAVVSLSAACESTD